MRKNIFKVIQKTQIRNRRLVYQKIENRDTTINIDLTEGINDLKELLNYIKGKVDDLDTTTNTLNDKLDTINDKLEKLKDSFSSFEIIIKRVDENVKKLLEDLDKKVKSLHDFIKDTINTLLDNIKEALDEKLVAQTGAIITEFTTALTGELADQTTNLLAGVGAALTAQTTALEVTLSNIEATVLTNRKKIIKKLNDFINNELKEKVVEAIKQWYKDNENNILIKITDYIC